MKIKKSKHKIEEVVYAMLLENTSTSSCDSGGTPVYDENGRYSHSENGYGRFYEMNRNKPIEEFINEPYLQYNLSNGWLEVNIPIFHHIVDNLSLDSVCDSFNKHQFYLGDIEDNNTDTGYSKEFQKWIDKTVKNFNDGNEIYISKEYNTYNGDSDVSRTYQYFTVMFEEENYYDCYIAIAIHLGCDVRGGYSYYKLFKQSEGYLECQKSDGVEYDLEQGNGVWMIDNEVLTEEQVSKLYAIYQEVSKTHHKTREVWEIVYKMAKYVFDEYLTDYEIAEYEEWKVKYEAGLMNSNPNQLKLI